MRIGEAIAMDQEDIDWENKEAIVVNVKSKEPQKVFFTDLQFALAEALPREPQGQASRPLSLQRDASPRGAAQHGCIQAACHLGHHEVARDQRADISYTHMLRKTFRDASPAAEVADIMAVKDLARHRSERSTLLNYAGVDKERSKAIHAGIMNDLLG